MGQRHERDAKSPLATSGEEEANDRDTIPAPEPKSRERLDPTPRVNRAQRAEEPAPRGDLLDQVMAQMSEVGHDTETWRPPPDPPKAQKPSSLAPRERTVASTGQSQERSSAPALLRVAAIFALCAGAFWLRAQWSDRSQRGDAVAPAATVQAPEPQAVTAPPAIEAPAVPQQVAAPVEQPAAPEADAPQAVAPDEGKAVPRVATGGTQPALGTPRPAHKRARGASIDVSHLPEEPSRQEVIAGLNQLRAELGECSKGRSGTAEIDLTIAGSGAVTYAVINGDYAGTPQGSCIARTIRSARFEPFKKPRVRILYRMSL